MPHPLWTSTRSSLDSRGDFLNHSAALQVAHEKGSSWEKQVGNVLYLTHARRLKQSVTLHHANRNKTLESFQESDRLQAPSPKVRFRVRRTQQNWQLGKARLCMHDAASCGCWAPFARCCCSCTEPWQGEGLPQSSVHAACAQQTVAPHPQQWFQHGPN